MPNGSTPEQSAVYPLALAFRRYLTTRPDRDLGAAVIQLSAELAAKNVVLALARLGERQAAQPAVDYERDTSFEGDYSELLVSFPTHRALELFTAELGEPAWEAQVRWLPHEDPPDVIRITRPDDGLPADFEAAREAIAGVSPFPLVLEQIRSRNEDPDGRYATWLPEGFPGEQVAYLQTEDWDVDVLSRAQKRPYTGGGS